MTISSRIGALPHTLATHTSMLSALACKCAAHTDSVYPHAQTCVRLPRSIAQHMLLRTLPNEIVGTVGCQCRGWTCQSAAALSTNVPFAHLPSQAPTMLQTASQCDTNQKSIDVPLYSRQQSACPMQAQPYGRVLPVIQALALMCTSSLNSACGNGRCREMGQAIERIASEYTAVFATVSRPEIDSLVLVNWWRRGCRTQTAAQVVQFAKCWPVQLHRLHTAPVHPFILLLLSLAIQHVVPFHFRTSRAGR